MLERQQAVLDAVRHLATAIAGASLYSPAHPQLVRLRAEAHGHLDRALAVNSELSLMVLDDELIVDDLPLPASLYISRFVELLRSRGIGHLKFIRGLASQELAALADDLSGPPGAAPVHSTEHIRVGRVEIRTTDGTPEGFTGAPDSQPVPDGASTDDVTSFLHHYRGIAQQESQHLDGLTELVANCITLVRHEANLLMAMAPLRRADEYTFTHSVNVAILNIAQAMVLGIDGPLLHDIGVAGLLHDIGKLFVPVEIITKPGRLDDQELLLIRNHPLQGARCLLSTAGVPRLAVIAAFEHHMQHNQGGYPAVADGWQQHLCSQMTALSDTFDALRSNRSYRTPLPLTAIAEIIEQGAGSQFHPGLADNFLHIIGRFADEAPDQPKALDRTG